MALFSEQRVRGRLRDELIKGFSDSPYGNYQRKAKMVLNETRSLQESDRGIEQTYDIFLSHSSSDAELVAGLKLIIEDLGYSVYIDWIEDPELNRQRVSRNTALLLQARMRRCRSLVYAFSENSSNSKWMPWELGYFDGIKGTVAVLPISQQREDDFTGTEYLGIYYYIQIDSIKDTDRDDLWVHESRSKYIIFNRWLDGNKPYQR